MCGLAGFWKPSSISKEAASAITRDMIAQIEHRGPDDSGIWIDPECGLAMGHRRLSVIDLSQAGHQPMSSACGRFVIAYNGEIYNFQELKKELQSTGAIKEWLGHSDTEVILAAFAHWGIENSLTRFRGMFAFALWDRKKRALTLGRDPIGEKPLYFGWQGRGAEKALLFGSDLASLFQHPNFNREVDRSVLLRFMRHNYVPGGQSMVAGIKLVQPGQFVTISDQGQTVEAKSYWDNFDVAADSRGTFAGTPIDAVNQLEELLTKVIDRQSVADVPLGAFLSGGIDSSTVVAIMQKLSSRPVKTFTIGFEDEKFNEAEHAKAIAKHLGTDHTELYVSSKQALDVIEKLPDIYSEPFADSSQIPMYLVSKLARSEVTVALSGDGGDELFAGYGRYGSAQNWWNKYSLLPVPVRQLSAKTIGRLVYKVPEEKWNWLGETFATIVPTPLGKKVHKAGAMLSATSAIDIYVNLVSHIAAGESPVLDAQSGDIRELFDMSKLSSLTSIEQMMALDMSTYLPGDILTKVDRATMAVSLESRIPMLDPEVIRFAWSLNLEMKTLYGQPKWPLRELLSRYVPKSLTERPKMGFGIPLEKWLKTDLSDWASELLAPNKLREQGFFDPDYVSRSWNDVRSGRGGNPSLIWSILMFQSWCQRYNF